MSNDLDQTPDARQRTEPEGAHKRDFVDETDVEGHSIRRDLEGEGHSSRRGADLGEGISKRNAFPDDGSDDVEGHSIRRGGERMDAPMGEGGEGVKRNFGPGEGHTSRQ